MVNIVENKRAMFCFNIVSHLHYTLIKSFINSGIDVIISVSNEEMIDKSILINRGEASNFPTLYTCDFEDELSVQQLQNELFENHYPFDIVFTDFSQPIIEEGFNKASFEELKGSVDNSFTSYFHLLKCVFPLMNSKNSHIYHLLDRAEIQRQSDLGIQILSNIASNSIFQMLMEDSGDPKINLKEMNLSLFWDTILSEQFSLESKQSSAELLAFLEKNSFIR